MDGAPRGALRGAGSHARTSSSDCTARQRSGRRSASRSSERLRLRRQAPASDPRRPPVRSTTSPSASTSPRPAQRSPVRPRSQRPRPLNAPTTAVLDRMVFFRGRDDSRHDLPARRPRRAVPDGARHHAVPQRQQRLHRATGLRRRRRAAPGGVQVSIDNPAPPPPDDETFTPWLGGPKEPGERFRLAAGRGRRRRVPESHGVVRRHRGRAPGRLRLPGRRLRPRHAAASSTPGTPDPDGFGSSSTSPTRRSATTSTWMSATAAPYFEYWHQIPHYYSYDVGGWHVVVLDSNTEFGQLGCELGAVQVAAGRPRAANTDRCTHAVRAPRPLTNVNGVSRIGLRARVGLARWTAAPTSCWAATRTPTSDGLPMDGVQASRPPRDLTEFVVGTGGRPILNDKHPEPGPLPTSPRRGTVLDLGTPTRGYTFISADGSTPTPARSPAAPHRGRAARSPPRCPATTAGHAAT